MIIMNDKYINELTEDLRDYARVFSGRAGTAGYGIAASTAADTIDKLWKLLLQHRRSAEYTASRKTDAMPDTEARIGPNIGISFARSEAIKFMESHGFKVWLEFDTGTAKIDDWEPMSIREFMAYASAFREGMHLGYEGNAP